MSETGYIYVLGWDKFQHPDVVRSARMPWIRDYVDQLDNEDYVALSLNARGALQDIRRLAATYGNGRISVQPAYLERRLNWPRRYAERAIPRLVQAGFIEIRASKAPAPRKQPAGLDREGEGSKEPKKEMESARANGAAENGSIATLEEQLAHRRSLQLALCQNAANEWLADLAPHLVAATLRQDFADVADEVIAAHPDLKAVVL